MSATAPVAILSLLHEPAAPQPSSTTRLFHGRPVLGWTLQRLSRSQRIARIAILCWDDQATGAEAAAVGRGVQILPMGPRRRLPMIEAVSASRRWADGWRGGLLGATCFDAGFHGPSHAEARRQLGAEALLLVDPAAALVDPGLLDALIAHAQAHPSAEYCFTPAAPGLSGLLIKAPLLQQLAASNGMPGRLLNYWPDFPGRDPISRAECAPVHAALSRTLHRFTLDSRRQIRRFECATADLNGQLVAAPAEALLERLLRSSSDLFPRDINLELNTVRRSRPIHSPATLLSITRPDLDLAQARMLFAELAQWDDLRLTLAGAGDPMLHSSVMEVIEAAHAAGIRAIHLETDLLGASDDSVRRLAAAPLDAISVHLPAVTAATYRQVMGVDALDQVIASMRLFFEELQNLGRATPLLVPTFVKLRGNVHEMEVWYDHWLRAVGCAVIAAPSDYAGQIADLSAVDMSPPARRPCQRLSSRLTILSDGRMVACENDVLGIETLGVIGQDSVEGVWRSRMASLRIAHAAGDWSCTALCARCRDWHRP